MRKRELYCKSVTLLFSSLKGVVHHWHLLQPQAHLVQNPVTINEVNVNTEEVLGVLGPSIGSDGIVTALLGEEYRNLWGLSENGMGQTRKGREYFL